MEQVVGGGIQRLSLVADRWEQIRTANFQQLELGGGCKEEREDGRWKVTGETR